MEHQQQRLIYIVDDHKSVRNSLSQTLQQQGYLVESFANPIICIDAMTSFLPDCILTSFEMPDMNGIEFCAYLKNQDHWINIPVLFLVDLHHDARIIAALKAGAEDYLPKEAHPELLLSKIRLMLELKDHREINLANHRFRSYRAAVKRLEEELDNVLSVLQPILERQSLPTHPDDSPITKSAYRLNSYLWKLTDAIRVLSSHPERTTEYTPPVFREQQDFQDDLAPN